MTSKFGENLENLQHQ